MNYYMKTRLLKQEKIWMIKQKVPVLQSPMKNSKSRKSFKLPFIMTKEAKSDIEKKQRL
jgi:hypothetical protein